MNMSPKGFCEGFLLRTKAGIIQINFGKDEAELSAYLPVAGGDITADVRATEAHGTPSHKVFELVLLHGADGHGKHSFAGRVERLNYALHGEVNGGILESGDFLHLKPKGAKALDIKVGMDVTGHGRLRRMDGGHSVIEAKEVNGVAIRERPE